MHVVVSLETVLHIVAQIRVSAIFGVEIRVSDTGIRRIFRASEAALQL